MNIDVFLTLRRIAAPACVAVLLGWAPLHAQGNVVIEGRVVNGSDASVRPAGVPLEVMELGGGMSVVKSSVTDASGAFRIDGLPRGAPLMVRATYKTVTYSGRAEPDASGKASVTIEVFEPTTSRQGITSDSARIAFQLAGGKLRCVESYSFDNTSKRTYTNPAGTFRISKAQGLTEPPRISVTAPGATMPLTQAPLESADGKSYYLQYPLRPGVTTFEVDQTFPYENSAYVYRKTFHNDFGSVQIGVIPQDIEVKAEGLSRVEVPAGQNFAVYSGGAVKAGTGVVWTFSGGTPVVESPVSESQDGHTHGETKIKPMPAGVAQHALVIGPLLLMGFVVVLWYAYNHLSAGAPGGQDARSRELRARREQLLNDMAALDQRYAENAVDRRGYVRQREHQKRQLRRLAMLSAKK